MASSQPARVAQVAVDDAGILVESPDELVLDVLFDGRRIWSFWLHRDGEPRGRGHLVAWPDTLRDFLDGTTRLSLVVHATHETVYDGEVRLGGGAARIAVVNSQGQPLALDKSLRRVQTFDTRSADQVEPLLRSIDEVLTTLHALGVDAFLAYGTLLGAVRDGRLIGHDSDADLGYLSRHESPVDVSRESFRLQRALAEQGYPVTRYSGAAFKVLVRESDGSIRGLDVFAGFLLDGRLHLMGEIREPFRREWVLPLGTATLEGREFAVPHDTDRFLSATYGSQWRVPDPAFHFATPQSTHRRLDGWFRGIRVERPRWDRVYSHPPPVPTEPSDLLAWMLGREAAVGDFVDLGCGVGGDVLAMARGGVPSVGVDFVARGFAKAQRTARDEGLPAEYWTGNLLELRSILAVGAGVAWRGHPAGPRLVAARHVLDAVGGIARRHLFRSAGMMLRDGGRLYLQFLTGAGEDGYADRLHVSPCRESAVARDLAEAGARIVHRERVAVTDKVTGNGTSKGTGAAGAPSEICRMVAQWVQ